MKSRRPGIKTKKELKNNQKKQIIVFLLVVFICIDFVWIMNHKRFKLSDIKITGNETVLSKDISSKINERLDSKLLGVLSRNNILFINTQKIELYIENSFPKIYNTKVSIEDGSILIINVEERKPHSLWCSDENYISLEIANTDLVSLEFNEECYFADQKGYIYTRAPYFSDGVFQKIYTTDDLLQIGEQVMDKNDFTEFFEFTQNISDKYNMRINRVFINERNETKIYIQSLLKENFSHTPYLMYKNSDSYDIVARNIGLMLGHEVFKKDFKRNAERLEFIDLRIDKQIRFKFTTDEEWMQSQNIKNEKTNETTE